MLLSWASQTSGSSEIVGGSCQNQECPSWRVGDSEDRHRTRPVLARPPFWGTDWDHLLSLNRCFGDLWVKYLQELSFPAVHGGDFKVIGPNSETTHVLPIPIVPGPLPLPPATPPPRDPWQEASSQATRPDSLPEGNVKLTMGWSDSPVHYPKPATMCGRGPFLPLQASVSLYAGL